MAVYSPAGNWERAAGTCHILKTEEKDGHTVRQFHSVGFYFIFVIGGVFSFAVSLNSRGLMALQ